MPFQWGCSGGRTRFLKKRKGPSGGGVCGREPYVAPGSLTESAQPQKNSSRKCSTWGARALQSSPPCGFTRPQGF